MIDVLTRALRHPIDYSGITRITTITLKEKIHETGDIYSFIFEASSLPRWKAGQHAIFTIPDRSIEGKSWQPFSVASAPGEGVIRIGTIVSAEPSSFKKELSSLNPGDQVRMYGPYGELYVRIGTKQIVGIAGGIGITPFRSIVADLTERQSNTKLTLIYSARENQYAFQVELEKWRAENPNIQIIYTATPEEVNTQLQKQVVEHKNNADYLLSGPPKMVGALRASLKEQGVKGNRVLNDPFKGY